MPIDRCDARVSQMSGRALSHRRARQDAIVEALFSSTSHCHRRVKYHYLRYHSRHRLRDRSPHASITLIPAFRGRNLTQCNTGCIHAKVRCAIIILFEYQSSTWLLLDSQQILRQVMVLPAAVLHEKGSFPCWFSPWTPSFSGEGGHLATKVAWLADQARSLRESERYLEVWTISDSPFILNFSLAVCSPT